MKTLLNFSGIGFEVGQTKNGLSLSTDFARKYFHYLNDTGLDFIDRGDCLIPNSQEKIKVHTNTDLVNIDLQKYNTAFEKTLQLLDYSYPLLNWGGDHSIALATVGAFIEKFRDGHVLWIDAHADLNLPDHSESGNLHGMPLAVLLNLNNIASEYFPWLKNYLKPEKLIYVGLRDIDPFEIEMIESLGIKSYDFKKIQELGMSTVAAQILKHTEGSDIHVSFDIDAVDPRFAPSTGVPVKAGLTPDDLDVFCEVLLKKSKVRSMDIVEINPELGTPKQVDRTFLIALNFLSSVFNSNIPGDTHDCISERSHYEQLAQIQRDF